MNYKENKENEDDFLGPTNPSSLMNPANPASILNPPNPANPASPTFQMNMNMINGII